MPTRRFVLALLRTACGGPQLGVLATETDFSIDIVTSRSLASRDDLAVARPTESAHATLDVRGPDGPTTAPSTSA